MTWRVDITTTSDRYSPLSIAILRNAVEPSVEILFWQNAVSMVTHDETAQSFFRESSQHSETREFVGDLNGRTPACLPAIAIPI